MDTIVVYAAIQSEPTTQEKNEEGNDKYNSSDLNIVWFQNEQDDSKQKLEEVLENIDWKKHAKNHIW